MCLFTPILHSKIKREQWDDIKFVSTETPKHQFYAVAVIVYLIVPTGKSFSSFFFVGLWFIFALYRLIPWRISIMKTMIIVSGNQVAYFSLMILLSG
jgi:hypothetical protein